MARNFEKVGADSHALHHRAGRMLWGFFSDDLQSNTSSSILARLLPLGVHEALGQTQGSIIQLQKTIVAHRSAFSRMP